MLASVRARATAAMTLALVSSCLDPFFSCGLYSRRFPSFVPCSQLPGRHPAHGRGIHA